MAVGSIAEKPHSNVIGLIWVLESGQQNNARAFRYRILRTALHSYRPRADLGHSSHMCVGSDDRLPMPYDVMKPGPCQPPQQHQLCVWDAVNNDRWMPALRRRPVNLSRIWGSSLSVLASKLCLSRWSRVGFAVPHKYQTQQCSRNNLQLSIGLDGKPDLIRCWLWSST